MLSAAGFHQSDRNARPSTMPAQKKASHGSSGWVRFTKMSNSSPRGERLLGLNNHVVG